MNERLNLLQAEIQHELRRFRHLFRNAYVLNFDANRLALVRQASEKLETTFHADFDRFMHFLEKMSE